MSLPIPQPSDRPAIVERDGWKVLVYVHDAEYLRQRSEWREKLRAHPDTGGTAGKFRRVHSAYERWRKQEETWYLGHGLTPPTGALPTEDVSTPPLGAGAHLDRARGITRLALIMADGEWRTRREMSQIAGVAKGTLWYGIKRLRDVGAKIERSGDRYRLAEPVPATKTRDVLLGVLADGRPHRVDDLARAVGIPVGQLSVAVQRLRGAGYPVVFESAGNKSRQYRLVKQ